MGLHNVPFRAEKNIEILGHLDTGNLYHIFKDLFPLFEASLFNSNRLNTTVISNHNLWPLDKGALEDDEKIVEKFEEIKRVNFIYFFDRLLFKLLGSTWLVLFEHVLHHHLNIHVLQTQKIIFFTFFINHLSFLFPQGDFSPLYHALIAFF